MRETRGVPTWSARRSGREPPRAAWAPSQGVRRQATRPSLPAATLWPATDISTSHMLGASCHSTKLPSWARPPPPPPPLLGSCSIDRRTRPDAYMLLTAPSSSFPHPVVALNCSMMYCADDATCTDTHTHIARSSTILSKAKQARAGGGRRQQQEGKYVRGVEGAGGGGQGRGGRRARRGARGGRPPGARRPRRRPRRGVAPSGAAPRGAPCAGAPRPPPRRRAPPPAAPAPPSTSSLSSLAPCLRASSA